MDKILLLCGYYHSDSNANAVCEQNIAKELKKRGYSVYTISYSFKKELDYSQNEIVVQISVLKRIIEYLHCKRNVFIFRLLHKVFVVIRKIIIAPFFPSVPSLSKVSYYKSAIKLIEEEKIDTIIGFYKPFDAIECAYILKKRFKDRIKVFTYHLDLLNVSEDRNTVIRKYKEFNAKRFFSKEICLIDHIFIPCSEENKYNNNNISYVDFPLFEENSECLPSEIEFDKSSVNIVYIGSLDFTNRNPKFFISLIDKANEVLKKKIIFHIWGNVPQELICNSRNIAYHGTIQHRYVMDILKKCDYVVNIGNLTTYQWIPSKIFQLFSTGKPIINIIRHPLDVSQDYFNIYSNSCDLYEYNHNIEDMTRKLIDYLTDGLGKLSHNANILFDRSRPSYFVSEVEKYSDGNY